MVRLVRAKWLPVLVTAAVLLVITVVFMTSRDRGSLRANGADARQEATSSDGNSASASLEKRPVGNHGGRGGQGEGVELPVPEDTKALARHHGGSGPKRLSDAKVVWEKEAARYVNFLKDETFEQGSYRTYMKSELIRVMGETFTWSPHNPDVIRLLCRTRRFAKLIREVYEGESARERERVTGVLAATVERLLAEVRQVEEKLEALAEEEPEMFRAGAPEEKRYVVGDLTTGYGLSGLEAPEGVIPMSLQGASLGLAANSFLLGLTEEARAVAPLLKIARYDDIEFQGKMKRAFDHKEPVIRDNSLANFGVIADALDRILVACAGREKAPVSRAAVAVAEEYVKWRSEQKWGEREVIEVYPYDAPQTPYHLPGHITGEVTPVETMQVSLPLPLARLIPGEWVYERGMTPLIGQILDWAERFEKAL